MSEKLPPDILYLTVEEAEKFQHYPNLPLPEDMTGLHKYTRQDELTDDEVEGLKLSSAFFATVAEKQAYNRAIDDLRKRGMIRRGR